MQFVKGGAWTVHLRNVHSSWHPPVAFVRSRLILVASTTHSSPAHRDPHADRLLRAPAPVRQRPHPAARHRNRPAQWHRRRVSVPDRPHRERCPSLVPWDSYERPPSPGVPLNSRLAFMSVSLNEAARRILDATNPAVLATINPDGSPQTSVIWVGRDGDDLLISTQAG